MGDARDIPVIGRGSVSLHCKLPNGIRTVVLHSALHVPCLSANLVSLGMMQRAGVTHLSQRNGIMVTLDREDLLHMLLRSPSGMLYHVDLAPTELVFATNSSESLCI